MKQQIVVIGGGASGMMAAIAAAQSGAKVTVLEHKDTIGKKILATGNGRCNFTNVDLDPQCYHTADLKFIMPVFMEFANKDTIQYFLKLGIYSKNRNGGLYPQSNQASAVLDVLTMELKRLQVAIQTEVEIQGIQKETNYFSIQMMDKREDTMKVLTCDKVILACGSKASPATGSDGSGYALAKSLGHHIRPVVPALVGLHCKEPQFKALAGVRVDGTVTIQVEGEMPVSDKGELQLTKYGISGIPVFQVSYLASRGLFEGKNVCGELDFMSDFTEEQLDRFLEKRRAEQPERTAGQFFIGLFPKQLGNVLWKRIGISLKTKVEDLSPKDMECVNRVIKHFRITIISTNDFTQAQVCSGGILTEEIAPMTMESKLVKGLYFCGEIIDVDGICGGYNLQWAWSSGHTAGVAAAYASKGE